MKKTLESSLTTLPRILRTIPPRDFANNINRIYEIYSSELDKYFLEGGDDDLGDVEQEILEELNEPNTIEYEVNTTRDLKNSEFIRQNQTIINKIPWFLVPSTKTSVRIWQKRGIKGPGLLQAKLLPGSKLIKGRSDDWVIVPENTVFEIIKETPDIIYTVVHPQNPYKDPTHIIPMSDSNVSQLSPHGVDYTDKYDPNWLNHLDQQQTQYIRQVLLTNPHLRHLFGGTRLVIIKEYVMLQLE